MDHRPRSELHRKESGQSVLQVYDNDPKVIAFTIVLREY